MVSTMDRLQPIERPEALFDFVTDTDRGESVVFVGRDTELRRLGGYLRSLQNKFAMEGSHRGDGHTVLFEACPGMGKTALLAQFRHRAELAGLPAIRITHRHLTSFEAFASRLKAGLDSTVRRNRNAAAVRVGKPHRHRQQRVPSTRKRRPGERRRRTARGQRARARAGHQAGRRTSRPPPRRRLPGPSRWRIAPIWNRVGGRRQSDSETLARKSSQECGRSGILVRRKQRSCRPPTTAPASRRGIPSDNTRHRKRRVPTGRRRFPGAIDPVDGSVHRTHLRRTGRAGPLDCRRRPDPPRNARRVPRTASDPQPGMRSVRNARATNAEALDLDKNPSPPDLEIRRFRRIVAPAHGRRSLRPVKMVPPWTERSQ